MTVHTRVYTYVRALATRTYYRVVLLVLLGATLLTHGSFVYAIDTKSGMATALGSKLKGSSSSYLGLAIFTILPGAALYITGHGLDAALQYTIVEFGDIVGDGATVGSILYGLKIIWTALRDITNIFIIGMFVFIAIATILGVSRYEYKKTLVRLLVVATLINFSFFFTQVIIDLSNLITITIYNAVIPDGGPALADSLLVKFGFGNVAAATRSVWLAGLSLAGGKAAWDIGSIFGTLGSTIGAVAGFIIGSPIQNTLFLFATAIVFTILSILFLRIIFVLIARFVTLLFLLATSGAAFAAMMIPAWRKWWEVWYKALLYNITAAPVLLLLLWAVDILATALYLSGQSSGLTNTTFTGNTLPGKEAGMVIASIYQLFSDGGAQAVADNLANIIDSAMKSLLYLALMTLLIYTAIYITNIVARKVASSAGLFSAGLDKALNWAQGKLIGGYAGRMAYAGRHTLGAGASSMADAIKATASVSAGDGRIRRGIGHAARLAQMAGLDKGIKRVSESSFDVRHNKKLMDKLGIGHAGKPIADGWKKYQEKREAEKTKIENENREMRQQKEFEKTGVRSDSEAIKKDEQEVNELIKSVERAVETQKSATEQISQDISKLTNTQEREQMIKVAEQNTKQLKAEADKLREAGKDDAASKMEEAIRAETSKINKIKHFDEELDPKMKKMLEEVDKNFMIQSVNQLQSIDEQINQVSSDATLTNTQRTEQLSHLEKMRDEIQSTLNKRAPGIYDVIDTFVQSTENADASVQEALQSLNTEKQALATEHAVHKSIADKFTMDATTSALNYAGIPGSGKKQENNYIDYAKEVNKLNESIIALTHKLNDSSLNQEQRDALISQLRDKEGERDKIKRDMSKLYTSVRDSVRHSRIAMQSVVARLNEQGISMAEKAKLQATLAGLRTNLRAQEQQWKTFDALNKELTKNVSYDATARKEAKQKAKDDVDIALGKETKKVMQKISGAETPEEALEMLGTVTKELDKKS